MVQMLAPSPSTEVTRCGSMVALRDNTRAGLPVFDGGSLTM